MVYEIDLNKGVTKPVVLVSFALHVLFMQDRSSAPWHMHLGKHVDDVSTTWNVGDFFGRREGTITDFTAALQGCSYPMTKAICTTTPNFKDTEKYSIPERRDPQTALMTSAPSAEGKIKSSTVHWLSLRCI